MARATIEERLTALEREVAQLKHMVQASTQANGPAPAVGSMTIQSDRERGIWVNPASEAEKQQALRRFLARANASQFRSTGPYPTRDELHERHS